LYMAVSPSESGLFSPLPQWRAPWSEFVLSYGAQAVVIAILAWIPVLHPEILEGPKKDYHAIELVPTPVSVNHAPQKQLPKPVLVAKLDPPPADLRLPAPQPQPKPKVKIEDTPAPEIKIATRKPEVIPPAAAPVIPRQAVKTNVFSTGSSAPQTIARAPEKVQTGGFGDPNGVPAKTTQTQAVNIAQSGGFDMPTGSGSGNGTGGDKGSRGVVASNGFGGEVATGNAQASTGRVVREAGFGSTDVAAPPTVQSRPAAQSAAKIVMPELLFKPKPIYTQEAKSKRIEGEVLVEVVFEASGKLRVLRVVRGLGYGLDDAAVQAVEQTRFKPALQDGQPLDYTAILHVVFQLA
jgi:TonB family protein